MTAARPASKLSSRPDAHRTVVLRWLGLAVLLATLLTRAMVPTTTLPAWDMDPTYYAINTPALGPAGSMLIDALALLGAAAILVAEALAGRRVHPLWLVGAGVGTAMALLHGWRFQAIGSAALHGTLGNQRMGLAWVSAVWGAVAVLHAAREPAVRRAVAGFSLAFVAILALRGVQQVFIDHPITLAAFNADRDRWLAARGWSPDSPMAKAYIRRMSQPEATGWFGLSNVVASFAGMGLAISAAWLWSLTRSRAGEPRLPRSQWLGAAGGLLASAVAVYLAGSKGGYFVAALALGLVVLGVLRPWPTRLTRLGALLGPLAIVGVLAAVALRGLVGERIGELSIHFRWFYMQGAARIFAEYPLTGVGPDGFQLAYLTVKNPLNPEEVTSPHSILLDWLSTLGAAGAAWAAVLLALSIPLGRALLAARDHPPPEPGPSRDARRAGMLALAAATIGAAWLESPYITPDSAILRVVGLAIGCGLIHAVLDARSDRAVSIGLAAGALAMLAHAQIELTGSNPASCGLFLIGLAAAAGAGLGPIASTATPAPASRPRPLWGMLGAMACAAVAGVAIAGGAIPARAWDRDLKAAAAELRPLAETIERFSAMNAPPGPGPREDPQRFFADLSKLLGRTVPATPKGWEQALAELEQRLLPAAATKLEAAVKRYPDEWRVAREASRLYLRLQAAASRYPMPGDPRGWESWATQVLSPEPKEADIHRAGRNPPRLRALALASEISARQGPSDAREQGLAQAVAELRAAFEHDPYNLDVALRLFRLSRELKRPEDAARFAARALELDDFCRLDRATRGLSPQERAELQAVAGSGSPGGSIPPPP